MIKPKLSTFRASKLKLVRARRNFRSHVIREAKNMASLMERYAKLMTPRSSMSLEASIASEVTIHGSVITVKLFVREDYAVTKRPGYTVSQYAKIMHDTKYNLGKISQIKNQYAIGARTYVGNQFLNRAGHLVWNKRKEALRNEAAKAMIW